MDTARREAIKRGLLLEHFQDLSVTMLKAATTAMAACCPEETLSLVDLEGGCLAFSGSDVPLSRAIGIGTKGAIDENCIETVERFYRSRNSPVRIVISERTDSSLPQILNAKGYESQAFMQNWWLPLDRKVPLCGSGDIEIISADPSLADVWARTVAAGFEEEKLPVNEARIPQRVLDTFYCLGFAHGAQPFFAKYKDTIVGGGVLHITGETASIRTTSCRIEYRNKGVQRALLAFRLYTAAREGCRFAFSSTDKPGPSSRNLQRFGFQTLSTSFTMSS